MNTSFHPIGIEGGTKRENEFIAHYHKFAFSVSPANGAKEGEQPKHTKRNYTMPP